MPALIVGIAAIVFPILGLGGLAWHLSSTTAEEHRRQYRADLARCRRLIDSALEAGWIIDSDAERLRLNVADDPSPIGCARELRLLRQRRR
jgi:hypothetical protein